MKSLLLFLVCLAGSSWATAQDFDFKPPAFANDPTVPAVMRDLAGRVLPVYQENDQDRYLRNLSGLQLVAGNYTAAWQTRQQLLGRRKSADAHRPIGKSAIYDIYAYARAREADDKDYEIKGTVVAIAADRSSVTLDHEDIPGLMKAMKMKFRVADPKSLDGLSPGDRVRGRLKAGSGDYVIARLEKQ